MAPDRLDALFAEFFRDLAIAWRALSAYPPGHPAATNGVLKARGAIARLLAETGPLELVVARAALLWSDRRFASPTAMQLARLLRRRRAACLHLEPGLTQGDLETLLGALALDNRSAREAGPLATELAAAGLVRIRVSDLDFSGVALVEGDEEIASPAVGALARRLISRLLLAGALPPAALAEWISSGRSAADLLQLLLESGGTDPALAGWGPAAFAAALHAAASDFGESPDAERAAGIAGIYQQLRAVDRERLLVELALALAPRGESHAAGVVSGQPALEELQAALPAQAAAGLSQALARVSVGGPGDLEAPEAAAPRLRASELAALRRVFTVEDLDALRDGEAATEALEALLELPEARPDLALPPAAAGFARELTDASAERAAPGILLELAEQAEVAAQALPAILHRVETGYRRLLAAGQLRRAITLVERVGRAAVGDDARSTSFRRTAERMSGRESLEALVGALAEIPEESLTHLPELLERLGSTAVRHLLGVLAETDNRRLRHLLLDLLAGLGPAVVRDATALLADSRWYVVRNMLLLLRRVGDPGSVPAVRICADHADLRVRLEAIRNLFAFDRDVPRELLRRALTHRDPRQAEAAMELAGEHGILEAVEPIVSYLQKSDLFGRRRGARLKAIRALAAIGDPAALSGLRRFRARFQIVPPALEERRELYRTLAAYPAEARSVWIDAGRRSGDGEIRRLAAALAGQPEVPA